MATTIQVKDLTKQRLDILKEKMNAASYDEVIMQLTEDDDLSPRKMFGSMKGTGPWTKADRPRFKHELDD